jgi:aspartyl-tRNA(Asn)/glutamyl-tRNA(Gln) amidotransferase subunit A
VTDLVGDPGSVRALASAIRASTLTSKALVERCLARIEAVDGTVMAWRSVDRAGALADADACDREAASGVWRGPLHGIPFGIKDIIDVQGVPTRAGSRSRANAPPALIDATVVARLRAQGAVPLGKAHTTEFAYYEAVPPTRNPHDITRTPGGSSAGSAAAVASGTVPFALGSQTAGSVSRPAAFCGIGAFKPSTQSVIGAGVTPFAPSFDTVGVLAATAADAAFVVAAMAPEALGFGTPAADPATIEAVFLDDPLIDELAEASVHTAMTQLCTRYSDAGITTRTVAPPVSLGDLKVWHRTISSYELGRVHADLLVEESLISPRLAADIRAGQTIADAAYRTAQAALIAARQKFWTALPWPALVVLPAALGPAPVGEATGDPSFIAPMTALGGPIASIPTDPCAATGAPLGAMICAPPAYDASLAALLYAEPSLDVGPQLQEQQ